MATEPTGLESLVATSVRAMLTNQHATGAFVASPDFAPYHYCWLRDGSFVAYALDRAGQHESAARFHHWGARALQGVGLLIDGAVERARLDAQLDPTKMPPARFALDGAVVEDDWPNFQIDGYGTWLWALHEHLERSGDGSLPAALAPAVELAAHYLSELGTTPCFDVWEENGDAVHTATLGSIYAGLVAASSLLNELDLRERAEELRSRVLARAHREGRFAKSSLSNQVDAALLWLATPFGLAVQSDPAFIQTAHEVSTQLNFEGGIRRYPTDTYYGGGAWPVLTASFGWVRATAGELGEARRCLSWVAERFDEEGHLAEQFGGERRDAASHSEWVRRWGPPAKELLWSHAMFVALNEEIRDRSSAVPDAARHV
jgi:GH15 family glucan-1,4-alpha-glucosidase